MSAPSRLINTTLTRDLAWAIAQDGANRQMRAAGRSKWSRADYDLAIETFDRLWPKERDYGAGASLALSSFDHEELHAIRQALSVALIRNASRKRAIHTALSKCLNALSAKVVHVDADTTNNDLDNLEVRTRTGYADVDPDRKGRES